MISPGRGTSNRPNIRYTDLDLSKLIERNSVRRILNFSVHISIFGAFGLIGTQMSDTSTHRRPDIPLMKATTLRPRSCPVISFEGGETINREQDWVVLRLNLQNSSSREQDKDFFDENSKHRPQISFLSISSDSGICLYNFRGN
jgi:hypothetical protein